MQRRHRLTLSLCLFACGAALTARFWSGADRRGAPALREAAPPPAPRAPSVEAASPPRKVSQPAAARAARAAPALFPIARKERLRAARTLLLDDPPAPSAPPEEAALRALERHAPDLAPLDWARSLAHRDTRRFGSGFAVRFEQRSKGVPVLGGGAVVAVGPRGEVTYASVRMLPGLADGASPVPAVGADEARAAAAAEFAADGGVAAGDPDLFVVEDEPEGVLAWVVPVSTRSPYGSYLVDVDAVTGGVIASRDILKTATGRGKVFRPNPVASHGNTALRDGFDRASPELDGALAEVDLEDLDGSGLLRGPLVDVTTGDGTERVDRDDLQFDFRRHEPGFEQVMCYAHLQQALAYAGTLGRPDPLDRALVARARFSEGGDEVLNAFFDPADGTLSFGTEGVDLAEDGTVVLHELGHALQDAAASTPGLPFGATHQGGSMGEGFSDYWAVSVLEDLLAHEPTFIGQWVSHGNLDYPFGDALFRAVHRSVATDKVWPRDADPGRDIHLDGEIWSAALWEIRGLLGRDKANRLAIESHYLLMPTAGFQEGSLALIEANRRLFGGARESDIEEILERRGLFDPDGPAAGDDEFEENDSPGAATFLFTGGDGLLLEDLICRDEDWYWIPVPAGKVLDLAIRLVHQNGDLDLGLAVFDPASFQVILIAASGTENDVEEIVADTSGALQVLADENGFIHFLAVVAPFEGAENDYDLAFQLVDSAGEEAAIPMGVGQTLDANAGAGDVDIAEFDGLAGTVLTVLTRKKGRLGALVEAELRDEAGVVFPFGAGLTPRGTRQIATLPRTGRYALVLRGAGGATGPYLLTLRGRPPRIRVREIVEFASDQEFAAAEFDALAGSLVTLRAVPRGRNPDRSMLEPVLSIFDAAGALVATTGDPGGQRRAILMAAAPATGKYFAVLSPGSGTFGRAVVTGVLRLPRPGRPIKEGLD
jgi:Zn-dependent metalloprotease